MKELLIGLALLIGGLLFGYGLIGNPLDELALIQRGKTTQGQIIDASEEAEAHEPRGTIWFHDAVYTYVLPDGRTLHGSTHGDGRLREDLVDLKAPVPIEVEYLPDEPEVSRIKGGGCESVGEWLWRRVGLGIVIMCVLLAPATIYFRETYRRRKAAS